MIIDSILDRKDGEPFGDVYDERQFYFDVMQYNDLTPDASSEITAAMDYGTDADVRASLCRYIDQNGYNPEIKNYINSRRWI